MVADTFTGIRDRLVTAAKSVGLDPTQCFKDYTGGESSTGGFG